MNNINKLIINKWNQLNNINNDIFLITFKSIFINLNSEVEEEQYFNTWQLANIKLRGQNFPINLFLKYYINICTIY